METVIKAPEAEETLVPCFYLEEYESNSVKQTIVNIDMKIGISNMIKMHSKNRGVGFWRVGL